MSQLRIVHAVSSLEIGGAERLVVDLARLQRRQGLAAAILNFSDATDDLCEEARAAGVDVVALGRGASTPQRLRKISSCLRSAAPSALHIHSPWCLRGLAPVLPFFAGSVVYTRHGAHAYDSWSWKALHAWTHRFTDHVTFVSAESLEVHRRAYGGTRVPLHVLEFGVDTDVPKHVRPTASRIRIGNVGRLVELKGQRHLVDAVALLDIPNVELHIFGDGPERAALEQHAARVLPGRLFLHGAVMDRDRIYEHIDVLAVASRMEGLSLVIMEAMAREIPVVATDVGGNPRLVVAGETGLLVPHADTKAMAAALRLLATDPALGPRYASAARALVVGRHSLEAVSRKLLDLYRPKRESRAAGHDTGPTR
jgi:glycosyltransferase involved in cell wall biosynthesis